MPLSQAQTKVRKISGVISEVSNDDIDNAQAESNAKDSDTEDSTAKDQRSKKDQ